MGQDNFYIDSLGAASIPISEHGMWYKLNKV